MKWAAKKRKVRTEEDRIRWVAYVTNSRIMLKKALGDETYDIGAVTAFKN